jgi:hypothetical protein
VGTFGETVDLREGSLTAEERAGAEQRIVERFGTDAWRYIVP